MKKGFTLIEFLVVLTLVICFLSVIFIATKGSPEEAEMLWMTPEEKTERNTRNIAEQLERQNDIAERKLDLERQKLNNTPEKEYENK